MNQLKGAGNVSTGRPRNPATSRNCGAIRTNHRIAQGGRWGEVKLQEDKLNVKCPVCEASMEFWPTEGWTCCVNCGAGVWLKLVPIEWQIETEHYPKGDNDYRYPKAKHPELLIKYRESK
jgi:Zn-finger nucleic acid-binding protein